MNSALDSQAGASDTASFARAAMRGVPGGAKGPVVNRTHRVVRERAKAMQERRSRARSLMAPLVICSVLLILSVLAVWTGMYQYQNVEADVSALSATDLSDHAMVALMWFVPVTLAVFAAIFVRRSRKSRDGEAL